MKDRKVSMSEFLEIYNKEFEKEDHGKLYGNDVTIHWNGIYCNVGDGATAYNHIISNIESVLEELGEE